MSQKDNNYMAVESFVGTKVLTTDNGNTRIFSADVSYTNRKTGKVTILSNVQIIVSVNIVYGGLVISISGLQDEDGCFVEHSTNFNSFQFANGQLTINGIDNIGTKGNYSLVIT